MNLVKDSMKSMWYKMIALKPLLTHINNMEFRFINKKVRKSREEL